MARPKNAIDVIVTSHLAPVLEPLGFTRHGRVFRYIADNGDAVVIGVQASSASRKEQAKFYINTSLVPRPWLEWIRKTNDLTGLQDPKDSEGAVEGRVRSSASGSWSNDTWICTLNEVEQRGPVAAEATANLAKRFLPLLDRTELLRCLETGEQLPGGGPVHAMRAILYLDAKRCNDARREIDDIASYQPESPFVTWVRQRLEDC